MREAVTLVSQALRVGELERADMNGKDADDGLGLLIWRRVLVVASAVRMRCECAA